MVNVQADATEDARWRTWRARGFARDARSARIVRWGMTAVAVTLATALIVAFVSI